MSSLVDLTKESQALILKIIEAGGEITPEVEQELSNVELNLAEKIDRYAYLIERLNDEAEHWKKKKQKMDRLKCACENAAKNLKNTIKLSMQMQKVTEVKGIDEKFILVKQRDIVEIDDLTKLPKKYTKTVITVEPDKNAIRVALNENKKVPGARLVKSEYIKATANRNK